MDYSFKKLRLEGESRFIPNLKFELSETQRQAIQITMTMLEADKIATFWFGPYLMQNSLLSMQALDLLNVLSHCRLNSENELELYRLKKNAQLQLNALMIKSRSSVKQENLKQIINLYSEIKIAEPKSSTKLAESKLEQIALL